MKHAVREICELLIALLDNYTEVVQDVISQDSNYQMFKDNLTTRQIVSL